MATPTNATTFNLTEAPVKEGIANPALMKRVYDEYNKLNEVVDQLGSKVSGVLAKQENEFLGAYRAHMYNVQRDLQSLRAEVVEKENALTNNEQMQKLEEECEWYRKESLRLDGLLGQSKKNEVYIKEKMAILEDDRNWLAKQLKSAKKQNKLLRAEIELQLREGTDAKEEMFEGQTARMMDSRENNDHTTSLPQLGGVTNKSTGSAWMKKSQSAAALLPTDTLELQKELRAMKLQRDAERKEAQNLRAEMVSDQTGRKNLEEFFIDCIEDVKKAIDRRRRKAASNKMTEVQEALLQKPIELHDFMALDRKAVVESLMSRDDVLSLLFDNLFPARVRNGNNQNNQDVSDDADIHQLLSMTGR
ncbi:hypothetical protein TrLO_g12949 [Triparma laevis f. longispina]|uniref:Cilia- and flagella-associated protein 157 n=1 Tax=Triparma laevis f. longispina TaxID=1714387 RepID=A0A9W7KYW7_9STRA|nr:hypothetical protein TrLO_g12949 [Triparma laevis f. longispina]